MRLIRNSLLSQAALLMSAGWLFERCTRRADMADLLWSAFLAGQSLRATVHAPGADPASRWVIGAGSTVWYGRLALHLGQRMIRTDGEDRRYQAMRQAIARRFPRHQGLTYAGFFLAQAGMAAGFAWPLVNMTRSPVCHHRRPIVMVAGIAGMGLCWLGQHVADQQLSRYQQARQAGRVPAYQPLSRGLWRLSRHPNYYFEWLHWCLYPLVTTGRWRLLGLGYPPLMYLFLTRLTGIPFAEKPPSERNEYYARYYQRTPKFFLDWSRLHWRDWRISGLLDS